MTDNAKNVKSETSGTTKDGEVADNVKNKTSETIERAPKWAWNLLVVIVIAFCLVGLIKIIKTSRVNRPQARQTKQAKTVLPAKPSPIIGKVIFPEGIDRQEFDLNPNGWVQVITPVGSKFRIDSPPDTDIWFLNGQKVKDGPYEANWVGIKVGNDVFWMRGKGRASVTIARIKR